jgi:hypothetical protein
MFSSPIAFRMATYATRRVFTERTRVTRPVPPRIAP